jgi:hypothetical protein
MPDRCSDDGATLRSSSILNRPVPNAEIGRRRAALAALKAEMAEACEAAALGARFAPP